MTKIMLVEDDKSLREIYGVRLLAEGYDIVSAADGEEALAMAIKERPKLIISDVMMPKISGFDMLDILRSTTETRDIKVIMMTALSSEDQRQRGEQLGADRYLVKSQVGIEDVIRVVHEVLGDQPSASPTAPGAAPRPAATSPASAPAMTRQAPPASPTPRPTVPTPATAYMPPVSVQPSAAVYTPAPGTSVPVPAPMRAANEAPAPPSIKTRVIQPLNDPSTRVDINELLDRELAKEAGIDVDKRLPVATTSQEKAIVNNQLSQISGSPAPAATTPPAPGLPTIQIDTDGRVSMPGSQPPTPPVPPAA